MIRAYMRQVAPSCGAASSQIRAGRPLFPSARTRRVALSHINDFLLNAGELKENTDGNSCQAKPSHFGLPVQPGAAPGWLRHRAPLESHTEHRLLAGSSCGYLCS